MKDVKILIITGLFLMTQFFASAQAKFSATAVNTSVTGTSTLHDWEMKSSAANCAVTATVDANGNITAINGMKFTFSAKSLKSGKGPMDKNAYKALKADSHPNIIAELKNAKVTTKDNVNYTVNATVALNIAGKTKDTDIAVTMKKINANTYSVSAKKKIAMSEYGVEPPSFMMGTVTTGNDVNIAFNFNITK
jgi:hypothetical protein